MVVRTWKFRLDDGRDSSLKENRNLEPQRFGGGGRGRVREEAKRALGMVAAAFGADNPAQER
jgi:hypothetical protein